MFKDLSIKAKLMLSFLLIALTTGITGMLGIYFTSVVGNSGEDVGVKYAPLGDAAMEIKLTATTAHLWLEEIVRGDNSTPQINK